MTMSLLFGAFVRRDWIIARSYHLQRVLELAWWSLELVLFYALGGLVNQTGGAEDTIIGGDYFAFVFIGLALSNIATKIITTFASLVRTEQMTGSLEAVMMVPRSSPLLIVASSSFGVLQALVQLALFLVVGIGVFGVRFSLTSVSLLSSLLTLGLAIVLFIAVGILIAAATLIIKQVSAIVEIVNFGIAILGGVYVPISLLPGPLPFVADLFPFAWAVTLARHSLLEAKVDSTGLLSLGVVTVLSLVVSLWVLDQALGKARRDGSLSQY
jgi:ABC-2 type transport system permease protein